MPTEHIAVSCWLCIKSTLITSKYIRITNNNYMLYVFGSTDRLDNKDPKLLVSSSLNTSKTILPASV